MNSLEEMLKHQMQIAGITQDELQRRADEGNEFSPDIIISIVSMSENGIRIAARPFSEANKAHRFTVSGNALLPI